MIRLGLCCIFREEPIRFRQTTASVLARIGRREQLEKLSDLCTANLSNLLKALQWCHIHRIGAFRILSPLFPRFTHPDVGYRLEHLENHTEILRLCRTINRFRQEHDIRLSLHPDQFNVLSSPHEVVVANTIRELEYQGKLAELLGADVINIHAGGAYGNKEEALMRFQVNFDLLSERVAARLTVENDDRVYTPVDLLPLSSTVGIPLVYDVHHHRCLPDNLDIAEATSLCLETWKRVKREPNFHISSPQDGWQGQNIKNHADYIDPTDFPEEWMQLDATVDVEAKAKELAVLRLRDDLDSLLQVHHEWIRNESPV